MNFRSRYARIVDGANMAPLRGGMAILLVCVIAISAAEARPGTNGRPASLDVPSAILLSWSELDAVGGASVVAVGPAVDGTCTGALRTTISFMPGESGTKSIEMAPVDGASCSVRVTAHWVENEGNAPARGEPSASDGNGGDGPTVCESVNGWAETGPSSGPGLAYTEANHEVSFCHDGNEAWFESSSGLCFANTLSGWAIVENECGVVESNPGPASSVNQTMHGQFEKQSGTPPPIHDMWNTIEGDASGAFSCWGTITGTYDGTARVDNCQGGS